MFLLLEALEFLYTTYVQKWESIDPPMINGKKVSS